jgi:5-methylcytosine-specific restriction endonuclease McrA
MKRTGIKFDALPKTKPLKRSRINPVSKSRRARSGIAGKLGIVRLYGKDLESLRRDCYMRDGGRCQFVVRDRTGEKCNKSLSLDGDLYTRAHMAHIKAKRNGGDSIDNVRLMCYFHHIVVEHGGGKVVPSKSSPAATQPSPTEEKNHDNA